MKRGSSESGGGGEKCQTDCIRRSLWRAEARLPHALFGERNQARGTGLMPRGLARLIVNLEDASCFLHVLYLAQITSWQRYNPITRDDHHALETAK